MFAGEFRRTLASVLCVVRLGKVSLLRVCHPQTSPASALIWRRLFFKMNTASGRSLVGNTIGCHFQAGCEVVPRPDSTSQGDCAIQAALWWISAARRPRCSKSVGLSQGGAVLSSRARRAPTTALDDRRNYSEGFSSSNANSAPVNGGVQAGRSLSNFYGSRDRVR